MNIMVVIKYIFDLIGDIFVNMFSWDIAGISIGMYIVGFLLAGVLISFVLHLIDIPRIEEYQDGDGIRRYKRTRIGNKVTKKKVD